MTEIIIGKCSHEDVTIIKACCSFPSGSGYIECGCGGRDEVVCNNPECTGMSDEDLDDLFEKPVGGGSDCD